jgi:tRNA pseudouridine38-40 synthase
MERNIKLTIAYDGTAYHGFQRQQNAMTVQQVLEERLAVLTGHPVKINGAARTDAGVHAYGQVANLYTTSTIPVANIPVATRGYLPDDIVVNSAEEVPAEFHARFAAKSKIYLYRLYCGEIADPFLRNYVWHLNHSPGIPEMSAAAGQIIGEHDFSAFRAARGRQISPVRTIYQAGCRQAGRFIEFEFWGSGFLYHMVRNLVGTLVEVGFGRLSLDGFRTVFADRDRHAAGITAPPQGLYLKEIFY